MYAPKIMRPYPGIMANDEACMAVGINPNNMHSVPCINNKEPLAVYCQIPKFYPGKSRLNLLSASSLHSCEWKELSGICLVLKPPFFVISTCLLQLHNSSKWVKKSVLCPLALLLIGVDCVDICPRIMTEWGCDVTEGVLECCQYTCRPSKINSPIKDTKVYNPLPGEDEITNCLELYEGDKGLCFGPAKGYCKGFCSYHSKGK